MNKAEAPCRPTGSLKFTIDNILNLKTSCDSCHSTGQQDDAPPEQRPNRGSRLSQSGKRSLDNLHCHDITVGIGK